MLGYWVGFLGIPTPLLRFPTLLIKSGMYFLVDGIPFRKCLEGFLEVPTTFLTFPIPFLGVPTLFLTFPTPFLGVPTLFLGVGKINSPYDISRYEDIFLNSPRIGLFYLLFQWNWFGDFIINK